MAPWPLFLVLGPRGLCTWS